MHPVSLAAFHDELEKIGLNKEAQLKELVRLGVKDIPGTPRLLMKARTPAQRAALGEAAEATWKKYLTEPMMGFFGKGLKRVPEGKAKKGLTWAAETIAEDPLGGALTVAAPGGLLVPVAKRGLRKAINIIDPVVA